jgi:hypothetical protein
MGNTRASTWHCSPKNNIRRSNIQAHVTYIIVCGLSKAAAGHESPHPFRGSGWYTTPHLGLSNRHLTPLTGPRPNAPTSRTDCGYNGHGTEQKEQGGVCCALTIFPYPFSCHSWRTFWNPLLSSLLCLSCSLICLEGSLSKSLGQV